MFGVSVQDLESHRKFAEAEELNFPLIADIGRQLSFLYGATDKIDGLSKRITVLIDKKGIVRLIDKKVQAATHGKDLFGRLDQLLQ